MVDKMNKSAQAHVEIILATVLFVGFLIFVFIFLNSSFRTNEDIPVRNMQEKILDRISSDIGKLPVIVNTTDDCYSLDKVDKDYGKKFVEVHDNNNPRKYTIYYGNFFDKSIVGNISCSEKESRNFSFGIYSEEEIIVEKKIKDLKAEYDNYAALKESLGVDDFLFEFKNFDGLIINELSVERKIPENTDVVSRDFPVRVMNNHAEIQELILNIKSWR